MLQFYLSFGRTQNFQVFSPPVTAYAVTAPSSEGAFALMHFLDRLSSGVRFTPLWWLFFCFNGKCNAC